MSSFTFVPASGSAFGTSNNNNSNNNNNNINTGFNFVANMNNNNNNNNNNGFNWGSGTANNNNNNNANGFGWGGNTTTTVNSNNTNSNGIFGLDQAENKEEKSNVNDQNPNTGQCSVFAANNNITSESDPLSLHHTHHIKTDNIIPACTATVHWNISEQAINTARENKAIIQLQKPIKVSPSGRSFYIFFEPGLDTVGNGGNGGGFNFAGTRNGQRYTTVSVNEAPPNVTGRFGFGMHGNPKYTVSIKIFDPLDSQDRTVQNAANWRNHRPQNHNYNDNVNPRRFELFDMSALTRRIIDGVFRMQIKISLSPTIITDAVLTPENISPVNYLKYAHQRNGGSSVNMVGGDIDTMPSLHSLNMGSKYSSSGEWHNLMKKMLNEQSFGDIEIVCNDGKRYRCHKDILSNFSPVFKAMLDHQMQESLENWIELKEENGLTMCHLLMYCYTGTISNDIQLDEVGTALLKASDKFRIAGLTKILFDFVKTRIEPETVAMALILCKLYRGSECRAAVIKLNKYVLRYLSELKNMRKVLRSKSFELLFTEHPDLVKTVLFATNSINAGSSNQSNGKENDDADREVIYFDDEDSDNVFDYGTL